MAGSRQIPILKTNKADEEIYGKHRRSCGHWCHYIRTICPLDSNKFSVLFIYFQFCFTSAGVYLL